MFEWLSKFERIFVTGPQRSGTRICAKMISHDTGYEFIDETRISMDSLYGFSSFMESKRKYVIQCPTLCRYIHCLASKDDAVVLMRRSSKDIVLSQKRIVWSQEWLELIRYDRSTGVISEIKYDFWEKNQKTKIQNAYEIEYDSLRTHPFWIDKQDRVDFSPMQVEKILPGDSIPINAILNKAPEAELFFNKNRTEGIIVKKSDIFHLINKTSLRIWEMCDGVHSKKDIFAHMARLFPKIPQKTLYNDIDLFIAELHKKRFITFNF